MTNALLVLLTTAALGASSALLAAHLGWGLLADILAGTAALCSLTSFAAVATFTVRRARRLGKGVRS